MAACNGWHRGLCPDAKACPLPLGATVVRRLLMFIEPNGDVRIPVGALVRLPKGLTRRGKHEKDH